ncbi:MAG TPA: hypothetical protein VI489_00685 [Candidatus Brocadiaceae bacterium]
MKVIDDLISKEKNGELEVEDILDLVKIRNASLVPGLKLLKSEIAQKDSYSLLSVPYDRWIDMVCEFLEQGYAKLTETARRNRDMARFAISVLEATKDIEGFKSIVNILASCDLNDPVGYENSVRCLSAINLMISFDDEIKFTEEEADITRSSIHKYLAFVKGKKKLDEAGVIVAYCALRKIGNNETINVIKEMPALKSVENIGVDKMVISAIKKRNKS